MNLREEVEDQRIDLIGLLLLHPVACAFDKMHIAQITHGSLQPRSQLFCVRAANNNILLPCNEHHRNIYLCAVQLAGRFPVTMEVSVIVDAAAKTRTL